MQLIRQKATAPVHHHYNPLLLSPALLGIRCRVLVPLNGGDRLSLPFRVKLAEPLSRIEGAIENLWRIVGGGSLISSRSAS